MPKPIGVDESEIAFEEIAAVEERPVGVARDRGSDLISLLRPGQWPKNVLAVSLPLLDLEAWKLTSLWRVVWAVAAFTIASSIVYVVNDLADRNRDRAHPTKRHRAIASGRTSILAVVLLLTVLFALLIGLLSLQPVASSWPIAAYLVLTTCYSAALKHVPLVDVFVVAFGFGLRMMQGYVAVGTTVSGWLLTCVFFVCLLLILGKRRHELAATADTHRPALRGYTVPLTDQLMLLSAVLSVGSYLLYVRTEAPLGGYALATAVLTAPLALFGLSRYLQMVLVHDGGENPVRMLLRDPTLVINSVLLVGVSGGFLLASHLTSPR